MQYGHPLAEGSSAANNDMMRGLWKYFGITSATLHRQNEYTLEEWQQMLYDELKAGNAVHYGGNSKGGGHSFVCDGYQFKDNTNFFHINWGWSPTSYNDGYYNIEVLAPIDQSNPEKGPDEAGFTYDQNIVRGLYPGAQAQRPELFCYNFTLDSEKTIKLEDGKISLPLTMRVANTSYPQFSPYLAVVVVDKQKVKYVIPLGEDPVDFPFTSELNYESANNYSITFDYEPSYGKDFTMYLAARNTTTEEWKQCRGKSECAFSVKDDNSIQPYIISPFDLKLIDSGVTDNTITPTGKQIQFTSRIKIELGSVHEQMSGLLEPIVPEGADQPESIFTNDPFMVYGSEDDVLDIRFTFDAEKVKAGSYSVKLFGTATNMTDELFKLTVTDATDIRTVADGMQQAADGPAYDLQGRTVSDSYQGVVIRNGKKTLNK